VRNCQPNAKLAGWRTTPYRLSATAYFASALHISRPTPISTPWWRAMHWGYGIVVSYKHPVSYFRFLLQGTHWSYSWHVRNTSTSSTTNDVTQTWQKEQKWPAMRLVSDMKRRGHGRISVYLFTDEESAPTDTTTQFWNWPTDTSESFYILQRFPFQITKRNSRQLSGMASGYGLDDGAFDFRQGPGIFLFTIASIPALGPIQPPIQWVPGAPSLGVKLLQREAHRSPPSSAEVKNAWSYTSTPPIRLHGVVLG
jgi:hypothetical protein